MASTIQTIEQHHAHCRATLVNYEAIIAHNFIGNHHADSAAFGMVEKFAANAGNPLGQRAAVLRHQYHAGMGLVGSEAGDDLSDEQLVYEFLKEMVL